MTENAKHKQSAKTKIMTAIKKLGGQCRCCGENTIEFLNFDHIEGKGEQKGFNNYRVAVSIMRGNTYNIRILCMNCNWSYGLRGYCPHRTFARFGKLANPGGYAMKLKRSTFKGVKGF